MTTEASPSTFDAWIEQASIPTLEQDLEQMQAKFQSKVAEYERLREEILAIDVEIDHRNKMLTVLREIRPQESQPEAENGSSDSSEQAQAPTMTKREMAERILRGALKPLYPREVRDIAVERGWLADETNAANQLSVAMNRAVKANKLSKDEEGRYYIPREDNGAAPAESSAEAEESGEPLFSPEPGEGDSL